MTRKITNEQYGGLPFRNDAYDPDVLVNHVNKESAYWWSRANNPEVPLPKFEKPVIQKNKVGWLMLFREVLKNGAKQLQP